MRCLGGLAILVAACTSDPLTQIIQLPPQKRAAPDLAMPAASEAGISVSPTHGLMTTSSGGTARFHVVLDSAPTDLVTMGLSSSVTAQATVSPAQLVFSPDDWDVPKTATVTGVDNFIIDPDRQLTIFTHIAVSNDRRYDGIDAPDVTVLNVETDVPAVVADPPGGLRVIAGQKTDSFALFLTVRPESEVTVAVSSSRIDQGEVDPPTITFTPGDFHQPHMVSVTGVDNLIAEGDQPFEVVLAPAVSDDPHYSGLDPADVGVINQETDVAGVVVTPTSGLTTTETGGNDHFTLRLATQPTANVTIDLSSSAPSHGTPSPAAVTFTPGNWPTPQPVTVLGHADQTATGNQIYRVITAPAISTDPFYSGVDGDDVSVTSIDSDIPNIVLSRTSGLVTSEQGGSDSFTMHLTTIPLADVTIDLVPDNPTQGKVNPQSVTFNATNWSSPQPVAVIGVEDQLANGNVVYHVLTEPAISSDAHYSGLDALDVSVTNTDDDIRVYGGNLGPTIQLVWCSPPTNCPTPPLSVSVKLGGTVNFFLSSDAHGAVSNDATVPAWFPNNMILLTADTLPPAFSVTPTATGAFNFKCWIHGPTMSGVINVVP